MNASQPHPKSFKPAMRFRFRRLLAPAAGFEAGLMTLFVLTTGLVLQFEMGFPSEGERYLGALLSVLLFGLSAIRLGRLLGPVSSSPSGSVLALAAGFVVQYALLRIAILLKIGPVPATIILLAPAFFWRRSDLASFADGVRRNSSHLRDLDLFERLLVALAAASLLLQFFYSLALPTDSSALAGHLLSADQLRLGGQSFDLLSTLTFPLLVMERNGIAANLLGVLLTVALLRAIYALSSLQGMSRHARLLAVAVIATCPLLATLTAKTSAALMPLVFFAAAAILFEEGNSNGKRWRSSLWFGLLTGFLFSFGAGFEVAAAVMAGAFMLKNRAHGSLAMISIVLVIGAFHLLGVNISRWSQLPGIFSSALAVDRIGYLNRLGPLLPILPWLAMAAPAPKPGMVGLLPLILFIGLPLGAWFSLLGALLLALPAGAEILLRRTGGATRVILVFAVIVALGASLRSVEGPMGPLLLHSRAISPLEYVGQTVKNYDLLRAGDQRLPKDARLFSVGEDRLFYLHRSASSALAFPSLTVSPSDMLLINQLRNDEFTHVMYTPPAYRDTELPTPFLSHADEIAFVASLSALVPVMVNPQSGRGIYELASVANEP